MRNTKPNQRALAAFLACGLSLQGCGLDKVEVPESLIGPSELGISIQMIARPDIVVADGIQTAVIQAVVRDHNGSFLAGRQIVFLIADDQGRISEIGTLTSPTGARVYGSTTATTNSAGIAQVIYTTPERRDFTTDSRIVIGARPVGTDANGAPYTTLRLEIRSAEPRRFPGSAGCGFVISPAGEPGSGGNEVYRAPAVLRLSSTSAGVRYQWYYGDGKSEEGIIETQHAYPDPGFYTITHIVTDAAGGQSFCQRFIRVD
jgi:hypothetical protein